MSTEAGDGQPTLLETDRLLLIPLRADDAHDMVDVLADDELYAFGGGPPPTFSVLLERYELQVQGPERAGEEWMNWIVRDRDTGSAAGFVQATLDLRTDGWECALAWLLGVDWQGRGFATEASAAMMAWLEVHRPGSCCAFIHPDHAASQRVAAKLGLSPTGELDADGEERWVAAH